MFPKENLRVPPNVTVYSHATKIVWYIVLLSIDKPSIETLNEVTEYYSWHLIFFLNPHKIAYHNVKESMLDYEDKLTKKKDSIRI